MVAAVEQGATAHTFLGLHLERTEIHRILFHLVADVPTQTAPIDRLEFVDQITVTSPPAAAPGVP